MFVSQCVWMSGLVLLFTDALLVQDPTSGCDSRSDELITVELAEQDPPLEGRGPSRVVPYTTGFSGGLWVWGASGELDPYLRIEDADGRALKEDDNSGGGTAACVALPVEPEQRLSIIVASADPKGAGRVDLHFVAAPESEATRAFAEAAKDGLDEIKTLRANGELDRAREVVTLLVDDLDRLEGTEQSALVAVACRQFWLAAYELGELAGALELGEVVHATWERLLPPDHPDLLRAKGNLALTRQELGDLPGALELEEVVHATWERLLPPDHPDLLKAKLNLAATRRELGDLAGALELEGVVHAAWERLLPPEHPALLAAKRNLAVTRQRLGDREGALALEEVVHAAWERSLPSDHPDLLMAKGNLAVTRAELGDFAGALEPLGVVHAAWARLLPPDHPRLLKATACLAAAKAELGDLEGALALEEVVHAAWERLLSPDHPDLLKAKLNLAVTRRELGDLAGAFSLLPSLLKGMTWRISGERVLSPREAWTVSAAETDRLAWVLFLAESEPVHLASLVELIETRRLMPTSVPTSSLVESSEELRSLRQNVARTRRQLGELISGGPADEKQIELWRSQMSSLWRQRDEAQRACFEILKRDPAFVERVRPSELATRLAGHDRAVGFLRYARLKLDEESRRIKPDGPGVLAMVVHPDGATRRVELGSATEIEELVRRWRAELGVPLEEDESAGIGNGELEAGKALRRRVLDPLLEGASTLYVCPDDVLHLVPLDALPLDDGERVGDRYQIRTEVSFARLLVPGGPSVSTPSLLALGNVDFDAEPGTVPETPTVSALDRAGAFGNWKRLPGTADEVSALRALFDGAFTGKAVVLTRGEASKSALTEQVAGKRYVHLATHAWFAPESVLAIGDRVNTDPYAMTLEEAVVGFAPLGLCGLCLASANHGRDERGHVPGLMTAEELAGLDLSECDLAVLSACETNVGMRRAGLGIQSLQSALHAAGARTAITSLWKVGDSSTRALMVELYTNLWKKHIGKAEALWAAKKEMRTRGYPVSSWAGWVLTGDPE